MPYPDNLLVTGEKIYVRKRPHWKVLVLPLIFFVLIIGACAALLAFMSDWGWPSWVPWALVAVAVVALIVLVLVPFIRWRTEHFVISNHHIFFRTGLLSRREHQIPLGQIANIETEVTFWGRLMGFGSLIVESSADQPLKFRNVANLPKVQSMLNQLIRDEKELLHRGHMEVDDWAATDPPEDGNRPAPPEQNPTGPTPTQTGAGQWSGQPYPQPGQGYPQQQGYPPQPGYPPGYPPQGAPGCPPPGYPSQGAQGYPPSGYQQTPGYPPNYPPQAGYQQGYPQQGSPYPTQSGAYPQSGYPAGGQQAHPPAGYPQGYQQPASTPPAASWGGASATGSGSASGEPPASAESTVYTRSPAAAGAVDTAGTIGTSGPASDDPEPTVLTRSPVAPPSSASASSATAASYETGSPSSSSPAAGAPAATPTRGRHAQPTDVTRLPNFDEPEPTVMMRSPGADDDPTGGGDTGTGSADPTPRA